MELWEAVPGPADIGLSGIVMVVVWMILTDRLVTRKRLEDTMRQRDKWQAAAEERGEQVSKLLVHAEVSSAVLSRMPEDDDDQGK